MSPPQTHKCGLCPLAFETKAELRVHSTNEHNGYQAKCDKCGAEFKFNYFLMKHLKNGCKGSESSDEDPQGNFDQNKYCSQFNAFKDVIHSFPLILQKPLQLLIHQQIMIKTVHPVIKNLASSFHCHLLLMNPLKVNLI